MFFTDGLVEHREHPIEERLERLAAIAVAHAAMPLHDFVQALADNHPSDGNDDMAILALRTPPSPGETPDEHRPSNARQERDSGDPPLPI